MMTDKPSLSNDDPLTQTCLASATTTATDDDMRSYMLNYYATHSLEVNPTSSLIDVSIHMISLTKYPYCFLVDASLMSMHYWRSY